MIANYGKNEIILYILQCLILLCHKAVINFVHEIREMIFVSRA